MTYFTQDWFSHNIPNFESIKAMLPECRSILEVGCFEGRATCWMLEHMLSRDGDMVCVDTFTGSEEHSQIELTDMYKRWQYNVDASSGEDQTVACYVGTSYEMLARLISEEQRFDFIYVDGSHTAPDVMTDACMAWGMLKPGGIMLFDDYLWEDVLGFLHRPKIAIDYFSTLFAEQSTIALLGYQYALRKL